MPNNPISPIGLISQIGHITKDIYLITVSWDYSLLFLLL